VNRYTGEKQVLNLLLAITPFADSLWDKITKDLLGLLFLAAIFLLPLLILTVILYLAGHLIVGGQRARFSDAFLIALLGTIISAISSLFVPYFLLQLVIQVVVWLALIKHFYETGWLGALAVAILSVIVFIVIIIILAFFAISFILFEQLLPPMMLSLL
jgi:hypothetical protein